MKERPRERAEPTAEREKPQRMIKREKGLLSSIAEGPAGKWLAGAALFLSAQGCGGAFREYRREVRTDILMQPVGDELTPVSGGAVTGIFRPRSPGDRIEVGRREHDPSFARPSDRLVEERGGRHLIRPESLAGRWYREMSPGQIYEAQDGHRYAVLAFRTVPSRTPADVEYYGLVPTIEVRRAPNGTVDPADLLPGRAIRPVHLYGPGRPELLDPAPASSDRSPNIQEVADEFFHRRATVMRRFETDVPRGAENQVLGFLQSGMRRAREADVPREGATPPSVLDIDRGETDRVVLYLIRTAEPRSETEGGEE